MKVLVIIPAYNEAANIKTVVENLIYNYPQYDYVVINDGSTDDTETICRQNGFNYISHPVNLGIGGSVQTGYLYAKNNNYDIAVQIDGDGQHDPKYIKNVIEPIEQGSADIVIGSRFLERTGFQSSAARRLGIRFLSTLIRLFSGVRVRDVTSGLRAVNRDMIKFYAKDYAQDYPEPEAMIKFYAKDYAQDYPEPEAIIAGVIHHARIQEVPVEMHERNAGKSSINPLRSLYYMIKVSLTILLFRITFEDGG
jgi:glycosyltransferase involved in cell wall biosynthesis